MTLDHKTTGERVRQLRIASGLSAVALAKEIGMNETSINNIQAGRKGISMQAVIKLALFFDVSIDYILGLTDDPTHHR